MMPHRAMLGVLLAGAMLAGDVWPAEPAKPIPFREEKPVQESASRALTASLVLLGVAGVALYVIRKRRPVLPGGLAGTPLVKVVGSTRMGAAATLWVVEFDGQRLLLAQSGGQVTLVSSRTITGGQAEG